MEYLWAILIFVSFFALTTILSGLLGFLIPITYALLGLIFGSESIVIGLGGILGSLVNYYNVNRYISIKGAMSPAPRLSLLASSLFILLFILTIILKYVFNFEVGNINYLYLLILAIIAWIALSFFLRSNRKQSLSGFKQSVVKFKIVEKYGEDPKWATYLYFSNGKEGWNQTIPGSFLAKNPENDLTFVHKTRDEALSYSQRVFKDAQFIDE
jgi:hypothetical protein